MRLKYYLRGLGIGIVVTALVLSIANNGKESLSDDEIRTRAKALGMIEEGTLLSETKRASENAADEKEAQMRAQEILDKKEETKDTVSNDIVSKDTQADKSSSSSKDASTGNSSSSIKMSSSAKDEKKQSPAIGTKEDELEDGQAKKSKTSSSSIKENKDVKDNKDAKETKDTKDTKNTKDAKDTSGILVDITISKGQSSFSVAKACEKAGLVEEASELDSFFCENGYDRKLTVGTHTIPIDATMEEIGKLLSNE